MLVVIVTKSSLSSTEAALIVDIFKLFSKAVSPSRNINTLLLADALGSEKAQEP